MDYGMDYQGDNAYGSGGGFTSGGGGGDTFGQQSSQGGGGGGGGSGNRRNYDEQRLIPVTCKMINSCVISTEDGSSVTLEDGRKFTHIKLVGAVRGFESNSTHMMYQIEDGTGLVEVKQWLDESGCTAQQEMLQSTQKEMLYVKVTAKLNVFEQKITPVADMVRPLSTGNELTHHFLEVVYSGEMAKQRDSIVQPASPMMGVTSGGGGVGFGSTSSGSGRTPLTAQGGSNGGDELKNNIMQYIQDRGRESDIGADVKACIRHFSQYQETEVRAIIENFQSEGMVYTTVDEDHVKSAM
ncbi:Replication protein A 32 kDa subunit [Seminavis robusta]|uniref:Replication protein A 32 kDa subunit n=1 Tax=Seminavis robusta TaxID=568900 RepID=A0A9N8HFK9_9STRA|nr:Replication protein A 32 kDa subunit [Seminavis robusta]|eukprot:Sro461_g147680.1 Replication protein A 32 kDa subunit (297) ;mRNA; f:11065-12171